MDIAKVCTIKAFIMSIVQYRIAMSEVVENSFLEYAKINLIYVYVDGNFCYCNALPKFVRDILIHRKNSHFPTN